MLLLHRQVHRANLGFLRPTEVAYFFHIHTPQLTLLNFGPCVGGNELFGVLFLLGGNVKNPYLAVRTFKIPHPVGVTRRNSVREAQKSKSAQVRVFSRFETGDRRQETGDRTMKIARAFGGEAANLSSV